MEPLKGKKFHTRDMDEYILRHAGNLFYASDVRSAAKFYLTYYSKPTLLLQDVHNGKVKISRTDYERLVNFAEDIKFLWNKGHTTLWLQKLLDYNEWLFKVAFEDVLDYEPR